MILEGIDLENTIDLAYLGSCYYLPTSSSGKIIVYIYLFPISILPHLRVTDHIIVFF